MAAMRRAARRRRAAPALAWRTPPVHPTRVRAGRALAVIALITAVLLTYFRVRHLPKVRGSRVDLRGIADNAGHGGNAASGASIVGVHGRNVAVLGERQLDRSMDSTCFWFLLLPLLLITSSPIDSAHKFWSH
jgi:hypothetical protein